MCISMVLANMDLKLFLPDFALDVDLIPIRLSVYSVNGLIGHMEMWAPCASC